VRENIEEMATKKTTEKRGAKKIAIFADLPVSFFCVKKVYCKAYYIWGVEAVHLHAQGEGALFQRPATAAAAPTAAVALAGQGRRAPRD
jgi:hypothetical protein